MTIDVSGIAWMIRRMDVSATIKNFVAVFSILSVPLYLVAAFASLAGMIAFGLDLEDSGDAIFLATGIVVAVLSALSPLLFILWDWVARQPWRTWAAINGALMGALLFAAIGAAIGFGIDRYLEESFDVGLAERAIGGAVFGTALALLLAWLVIESVVARRIMKWICIVAAALALVSGVALLAVDAYRDEYDGGPEAALLAIASVVGGVLYVALFLRAIRNRVVLSGPVPRELLLGEIHRGGFWPRLAFLTGLPSSLWHAAAMKTPAFWAFLFARPLVYAGILVLAGELFPLSGLPMQIVLAILLVAGGHVLFWGAKRLATAYAWDPERSPDPRPPVLFLRSFEDDQLSFRRPWWQLISRWLDLWSFRTNADEALIDEIAQYGPVVALGMPGEKTIPFGAMRHYATHEDWQRIVADTAKSASAIVIAAGNTPGVRWEYELLAQEGLLDKTLLLFPPVDDEATNRAALDAFFKACGTQPRFDVPKDARLIGLLPGSDSRPILLTAGETAASAYVAAIRGFFQKSSIDELSDRLAV